MPRQIKSVRWLKIGLDTTDLTVATVYGMREGVEVGYNPTKRGRSSYCIKTCFIANNGDCVNLRLDGGKSHSKTGLKEFFEDAARIDGCGSFQIFYKIMVPLSMQGVATVDILTFVATWDEFIFALILMESSIMKTLSVGIVLLRDEGQSWAYGLLSAAMVVSIIPVILFFIVLQRYFVRGMIEGSLKG